MSKDCSKITLDKLDITRDTETAAAVQHSVCVCDVF